MKYSLRSLMIVVTLFCVVVGGRIEYLRRMAEYHRREALRIDPWPEGPGDIDAYWFHRAVAQRYRVGLYRPWKCVKDKSPVAADERECDPLDPFWESP